MCTKKNEIYIVSQPKRLILSILVVDMPLTEPLPDSIHYKLGRLVDFSDVFFIFSEPHFKEQRMVDKIKFTSLYQGCGFIDTKTTSIGNELIKVLQYEKEIFEETKNHLGITIGKLSDVDKYEMTNFTTLRDSIIPNIGRPIFTLRRLTSSEFFKIYELKDLSILNTGFGKIFSTIVNALLTRRGLYTDKVGMYCTWHSESPFIYMPKTALNSILQYKKLDETGFNSWVNTFVTIDPRFMMASLFNYIGIDILNLEIEQVKV